MRRVFKRFVAWIGFVLAVAIGPGRAQAEEGPRVWAIVVGINQYEDRLIPRCSGSIRDARSVAEWISSTAEWGAPAVLRMDDVSRKEPNPPADRTPDLLPTRANLDWAVEKWLVERVKPGDVVVVYFAGQATARPPGQGSPRGRVYLLPIDARAGDLAGSGWSLDGALDRAGIASKARVVIWLDTSTSGRGARGLPLEDGSPTGLEWLGALTRWENVTAWLAADGRRALEDGGFVRAIQEAMGRPEKAHNLMGALAELNKDKALAARGFRAVGGVGPEVSLWKSAARVVERVVPELIVQAGHSDRVTSVVVTADNARMITASMDSTVRVWKLGEREPAMVRVLTDPFIGVKAMALDRDGKVLLAGDGSGSIFGWNMAEDRPKPYLGPPEHEEAVESLRFFPEGLNFVSVDRAGRSVLWDASGGVIRKLRAFSDEPISRIAAATRPIAGAPAMVGAVVPPGGGPDGLRAFDAQGKLTARFDGPGGRILAIDLSDDGHRLVVGDDRGRVVAYDLPGRSVAFDRKFAGKVRLVRVSESGPIAVGDDRSFRLVEPRAGGADVELALVGGVDRAEFSIDGRWLAACPGTEGRVMAWRVSDPARPGPVVIPEDGSSGLSPAFCPDGRMLVVGDLDGGVRAWSLEDGPGGPRAELKSRVKPSRGKVAVLGPSNSGKLLLQVTKDDLALIWDLEQGRGCRAIPGLWTSGAFLPDESRLILSRRPDQGGDLVVFDRTSNAPTPSTFARPVDVAGKPLSAAFGRVVVSKSGRWVAAAAHESQLPLACVWEVATGRLVHTARVHDGGLTALDFSGDEAFLLTASEDGKAKLWPLTDPAIELRASTTFFSVDVDAPAFTAAKVCPTNPNRVATGTRGGQVAFWKWERGRIKPELMGDPFQLNGEINSLAFSTDGRWLAASSSRDKTIQFWDVSGPGRPRPLDFKLKVHHAEQVGALAGWPVGPSIVSGGDDSALRFWDLKDRTLVGTLIAQARNAQAVDWLAFTPDGRFDGSTSGESMVRWRVGDRVVTLQQAEDTHYRFRIASSIARGEKLEEKPELKAEGPALKIFAPPGVRPGAVPREVELTLWSESPRPPGLRLYQNGVPVRAEGDFLPGESDHFARARVVLRKGENRLYAMASKPGSADGKSDELTILFDGPEPSGRLHTLALGISGYETRALKYAHVDAQGIADFLRRQGVQGADRPGERIVLIDKKVTEQDVEDAFRKLKNAVKGRPEDTVVLFLAGHTDTDDSANQFCLLLPGFPFPAEPPTIGNVAVRGPGFAVRGNSGNTSGRARVGDRDVLPYSILYNQLTRLEALQRLVIVDACQAGAILDDRAVAGIQKSVEWGSRKARNSYLLAARRGEPANEVDALEHGLLTYTLLRGMKAGGLKPVPDELGGFPGPKSADLDSDGFVSSDELVAFADETLPKLARMFPQVVLRAGGLAPARAKDATRGQGSPELEGKVRLQSDQVSFPLVVLPK